MGTDVAVRDEAFGALTNEQLAYIAGTDFVPPGLRNNKPAILACVATGRSIGIPDMTALRSIHIIDGKPTFSAELMVQLVRRRGHSIVGEMGEGLCTVTGIRADNQDEMTVTWTLAMAERAGLTGKGNWKKYPESMLWARAVSQLCRMLFADCFAGATYTPEELSAGTVAEWEDDSPALGSGSDPSDGRAADTAPVASGPDSTSAGEPSGDPSGEPTDVPLDTAAPATETSSPADAPSASAAQLKKLNVLVGQLREAGKITNEQLWRSTHREPVASEDGEVHWSPLRDSLSKDEASALIERLQTYADNLAAAA